MNRIYRTVWNAAKNQWQVAPETVKRQGKTTAQRKGTVGTVAALATGSLLLFPLSAFASGLPSGGEIRAGSGNIEQSGNTMRINQSTDRMAIDWDNFSVEEGHRVEFNQPGRDSAALNRVTGDQLSQIRGAIDANGQVFLVNPNGIVFGDTAQVDVGGLVASTLDISPEDFMAGEFTFEGSSSSAIVNQGNIRTADEGYVALIAAEIINEGSIKAPKGDVLMGAGSRVRLDMGGPIKIEVEEALLDTHIEQGGAIKADGGRVYLTAKAAGDLAASVINHTGVTQARTVAENDRGEIWLMGDMKHGETKVAGTLDASAPEGGDGGFIETSAAKVSIMDEAAVTTRADQGETGEWLIDPHDFTIADSSGDITGATLSGNLAATDVVIESVKGSEDGNGDIFVNDEVIWESGNQLTLNAQRNIEINSKIDASGGSGGKLALEYGQASADGQVNGEAAIYTINAPVNLQAGQNYTTQLGSNGELREFTVINDLETVVDYTDGTLTPIQYYALGTDISDAADTANWNNGAGWNPVGVAENFRFAGTFDGLGHTITGLTINRPNRDDVGFFGATNTDSDIRNIGLIDVDITGDDNVGGLVGHDKGNITNAYVTGSVSGNSRVGGLVGFNFEGSLNNTYATSKVTGNRNLGGLAGYTRGNITNSYATGDVTSTGTGRLIGGLVSTVYQSTLENVYATGSVTGDAIVGGLSASAGHESTFTNTYASGTVTGNSQVGGLFGNTGTDASTVTGSYYATTDAAGDPINQTNDSGLGVGKTLKELQTATPFTNAGWNDSVWFWASGAEAAGYVLPSLPYLTTVTRAEDTPGTLFNGGFGTKDKPFTLINWQQLQNINFNTDVLTGGYYYALANSLNTSTDGYNALASAAANGGKGWLPIGGGGVNSDAFTGHFNGDNNSISDLTLERGRPDLGLFGAVSNASITDLTLHNPSVNTSGFSYYVGSLAGRIDNTTVDNVTGSGDLAEVSGYTDVGGLVGEARDSFIRNSSAAAVVAGAPASEGAGGLVGKSYDSEIEDSVANGAVSGGLYTGGLVGRSDSTSLIRNAQAHGNVTASDTQARGYVGGFVGLNEGAVEDALATGNVTGRVGVDFENTDYLGVGRFAGDNSGTLRTVEASGSVTVTNADGNEIDVADGLLGRNTGLLADGYVLGSNIAYWLQPNGSLTLVDQPTDDTQAAADAIKNRLDDGVNVAIVTNGGGIDAQGPVDLGNAAQHNAALTLNAAGGITLESTQALRLGEVTADGAIAIATLNGDLTLTGDITTAATNNQALVLNAGAGQAAGTASGGDIVHTSGDLTTGNGGRTLLYTGSLAGSEDVAALINAGNFRYNSNETASNFTATLDAQRHLIYREQPEVLVSAEDKTTSYGDTVPTDYNLKGSRGYVNGDNGSSLSGTPNWSLNQAPATSTAGYPVVGNYRIDYVDGLSNALGYAIATDTANTGELAINPLSITAKEIADGQSVYGDSLTPGDVTLDGVLGGDQVTAQAALVDKELSSSDHVNVGNYDQEVVDDSALSGNDAANYTLDKRLTKADSYTVTRRPVEVTANAANKTYGNDDPTFTWQITDGDLVGNDSLTGKLSRDAGEDVGGYAISAADLANGNYVVTAQNGTLTIDPRPITVAANDQQKTYGNDNPTLTWQVTDGNLVGDDSLAGDLTRDAGEDVGDYAISAADLENGNYRITAVNGELTIDPRPITVAADDQQKNLRQ